MRIEHLSVLFFPIRHFCNLQSCSNTKVGNKNKVCGQHRWHKYTRPTFRRIHHCLWCFLGNLCTFHSELNREISTAASITVSCVGFGVNTDHGTYVRALDEDAIEQMLSQIVELVRENPSCDSDSVISLFPNNSVEHFSEPPNTWFMYSLPFL
jgi:hypothetical protein